MEGLSVHISSDVEDRLVRLIRTHQAESSPHATYTPSINSLTVKRYIKIYEKLSTWGFNDNRCRQCLETLPIGHATLQSALEWLLINLEASDIPSRFTLGPLSSASGQGAGVKGGGVKVLSVASDLLQHPHESGHQEEEDKEQKKKMDELSYLAPAGKAKEEEEEESKAASKAWIQKYLEQGDDSDNDDYDNDGDEEKAAGKAKGSDGNSKDDYNELDWEIWSDAREVARRKAERKDSPQKRLMLSLEYWIVKEKASVAKGEGDKQVQKFTGQMIKALKDEMDSIKLPEAVALALAKAHHHQSRNDQKESQSADDGASQGSNGGKDEALLGLPSAQTGGGFIHEPDDQNEAKREEGEEEEEDFIPFDLFDLPLSSTDEPSVSPIISSSHAPLVLPRPAGHGASSKKVKGQRQAPPSLPAKTLKPSALLNQRCLALGYKPPKLTQLKSDAPTSSFPPSPRPPSYRYSVSIDFGPSRVSNKKSGLHGTKSFIDHGDIANSEGMTEGGWPSIHEAQEASCCRALFDIESALSSCGSKSYDPSSMQRLLTALDPGYQAYWQRYEAEGIERRLREGRVEAESERRAFIDKLLASTPPSKAVDVSSLNEPDVSSSLGDRGVASTHLADFDWDRGSEEEDEQEEEEEKDGVELEQVRKSQELPLQPPVFLHLQGTELKKEEVEKQGLEMQRTRDAWRTSEAGSRMMAHRNQLPISAIEKDVLAALSSCSVVVIQSETGSGKTTQVPQFVLDEMIDQGQGGLCNIITTQPRRIAATSVADRVSAERGEPQAGHPKSTIGSHVRLEAKVHDKTRLTFMTTGILLRRMSSNPSLSNVTHVIIDEVHERTAHVDFLMALLRDLIRSRSAVIPDLDSSRKEAAVVSASPRAPPPRLKLILMSATLDGEKLSRYFDGCPILSAQGRTFPIRQVFLEQAYEEMAPDYVLAQDSEAALRRPWRHRHHQLKGKHAESCRETSASHQKASNSGHIIAQAADEGDDDFPLSPYYDPNHYPHDAFSARTRLNLSRLDEGKIDYELIEHLITHVDEKVLGVKSPGAILVFLPGMGEIKRLKSRIEGLGGLRGRSWILPLHSNVAPSDQKRAFQSPPTGFRKVVLATNIAETSLTIPDVVCCIDSGRLKEKRYDPKRCMSALVEDFISRDSSKQRKGRAGRVSEGLYIALFTRQRHEEHMRAHQVPEIHRIPLEELVLQVHAMGLGSASDVLLKTIEPPTPDAIESSLMVLEEVGAIVRSKPSMNDRPDSQSVTSAGAGSFGEESDEKGGEGREVEVERESLTELGKHLSMLPLEPRLGKLMVMGCKLSCLGSVATIAAFLSHKSPFLSSSFEAGEGGGKGGLDMKSIKRELIQLFLTSSSPEGRGQEGGPKFNLLSGIMHLSDHLSLIAAFNIWNKGGPSSHSSGLEVDRSKRQREVAKRYRLDESVLQEVSELRDQLFDLLVDSGLIQSSELFQQRGYNRHRRGGRGGGGGRGGMLDMNSAEWNEHSNSIEMIQAALLSSFPLQMAVSSKKKGNGEAIEWVTGPKMIDRIELSPSSLLSKTAAASSNVISPSTVILYSDRVKVGNKAVATAGLASPLSPVCLVLFSSHISVNYEESPTSATINGWLKVHLSARQAAIMKLFRSVYEHHQGNDKKHWAELSELLSDILKPRAFK